MRNQLALLTLLILTYAHVFAGDEVSLKAAAGKYYRPGAWITVNVQVQLPHAKAQKYSPSLELMSNGKKLFSCKLAEHFFSAGQPVPLTFKVIAGTSAPELQLTLKSKNGEVLTYDFDDLLAPLRPESELVLLIGTHNNFPASGEIIKSQNLKPENLPSNSQAYESCGLIALPSENILQASDISARQYEALAKWCATGGTILAFSKKQEAILEEKTNQLGWLMTPAQRFSKQKNAWIRMSGRGRVIVLDATNPLPLYNQAWEKYRDTAVASRKIDMRVSPREYSALPQDWPKAPKLSAKELSAWLAIWVMLSASVLWKKNLGKNKRASLFCAVSLLCAAAFIIYSPKSDATVITARARKLLSAGAGGPDFATDYWFAKPFGNNEFTVELHDTKNLPRLLAENIKEINKVFTELNMANATLTYSNRDGGELISRDTPFILTRTSALPQSDIAYRKIADEEPEYQMKMILPSEQTYRDLFFSFYLKLHPPGSAYRTMANWSTPEADGNDLGEMKTTDIPRLHKFYK